MFVSRTLAHENETLDVTANILRIVKKASISADQRTVLSPSVALGNNCAVQLWSIVRVQDPATASQTA